MTCLKLKNNYVADCIRKHMRINVKKQDEFYYKLAKVAKECVEYNYIYYIDIHTSDDLPDKEVDYLYWLVIGIFFKDNTIINNVSYSI